MTKKHDPAFGPSIEEWRVTVGVQTTSEQLEAWTQMIASDIITGGFRTIKTNLSAFVATLNQRAQEVAAERKQREATTEVGPPVVRVHLSEDSVFETSDADLDEALKATRIAVRVARRQLETMAPQTLPANLGLLATVIDFAIDAIAKLEVGVHELHDPGYIDRARKEEKAGG